MISSVFQTHDGAQAYIISFVLGRLGQSCPMPTVTFLNGANCIHYAKQRCCLVQRDWLVHGSIVLCLWSCFYFYFFSQVVIKQTQLISKIYLLTIIVLTNIYVLLLHLHIFVKKVSHRQLIRFIRCFNCSTHRSTSHSYFIR